MCVIANFILFNFLKENVCCPNGSVVCQYLFLRREELSLLRGPRDGRRDELSPVQEPHDGGGDELSHLRGPHDDGGDELSHLRGLHDDGDDELSRLRGLRVLLRDQLSPLRGPRDENSEFEYIKIAKHFNGFGIFLLA
jgi:hypothetical protein